MAPTQQESQDYILLCLWGLDLSFHFMQICEDTSHFGSQHHLKAINNNSRVTLTHASGLSWEMPTGNDDLPSSKSNHLFMLYDMLLVLLMVNLVNLIWLFFSSSVSSFTRHLQHQWLHPCFDCFMIKTNGPKCYMNHVVASNCKIIGDTLAAI